jgi:hypothetical protein
MRRQKSRPCFEQGRRFFLKKIKFKKVQVQKRVANARQ